MNNLNVDTYQLQDQELTKHFNFDDADVIIRAKTASFRVHTFYLGHVSPIFKDMFSLPHTHQKDSRAAGLPIVEVTEDAKPFRDFLALIYHSTHLIDIDLDDVGTLYSILLIVRKYSAEGLRAQLLNRLEQRVGADPVRTFAIACRVAAPEVAKYAARQALNMDFDDLFRMDIQEVNQLRAKTYRKLLCYHKKCGESVSQFIRGYTAQLQPIVDLVRVGGLQQTELCYAEWRGPFFLAIEPDPKLPTPFRFLKTAELVQRLVDTWKSGCCIHCTGGAEDDVYGVVERFERELEYTVNKVRLSPLDYYSYTPSS